MTQHSFSKATNGDVISLLPYLVADHFMFEVPYRFLRPDNAAIFIRLCNND